MTNCPYCSSKLHIDPVVFINIRSYGKPAFIAASCCKKGLVVDVERTIFSINPAFRSEETEDDWGDQILPSSMKDVAKPLTMAQKFINKAKELVPHQHHSWDILDSSLNDENAISEAFRSEGEYIEGMVSVILELIKD